MNAAIAVSDSNAAVAVPERVRTKVEVIRCAELVARDAANCRGVEPVGTVAISVPLMRQLQIAFDAYHEARR